MASPPIPSLEHLARRPFAFYPAIRNVERNEWTFRKATWPELVVVNRKTGLEISIPRRFVGEISSIDEPVLIVGLVRELEYREGAVWPYRSHVIEMPLAVGGGAPARRATPAPVIGIRLETRRSSRTLKIVGSAMAAAVFLGGVSLVRVGGVRQRAGLVKDHSYAELNADDTYDSVIHKLGQPATDRTALDDGHTYRALGYSLRHYTLILGGDRSHYLGTMDANWNAIHGVRLESGASSLPLLRTLKRF